MLADMPHLAKRDTGSDSETSGASDQHHISLAPVQLHATADKDVGVYFSKPRRSLLVRAGSRFGMKKSAGARTTDASEQDEALVYDCLARIVRLYTMRHRYRVADNVLARGALNIVFLTPIVLWLVL
ncbi:hypothetical protein L1887_59197 [Cichorium endivia]|nr:hypothetical protein L1887_59197 [Cichorium endivia]